MHAVVLNNVDRDDCFCELNVVVVSLLYIRAVFPNLIWPQDPFALENFCRISSKILLYKRKN
jgi:hypothetical protein